MTKDELYQQYLNSVSMTEAELIVGLDNLQIQDKSVKKGGVIYTPDDIVDYMIGLLKPKLEETIIEPSCGHGAFLFGLLKFMRKQFSLSGKDLLDWFVSHVTGIDISDKAIQETKEILCLYFKKHDEIVVSVRNFNNNLLVQDGLFSDNKKTFDLCIGNPPYIRTKNLDPDYLLSLRKSFVSCAKGNIDIYYAFIERFSTVAQRLCFIIPNGFLSNTSGKVLKMLIEPFVDTLVDFKARLIFKDARTYTSIILLNRKNDKKEFLYGNNETGLKRVEKSTYFHTKNNQSLEHISSVLSGIATLADEVYTCKKIGSDYFAKSFGEQFQIEKEILVPYLKLTKVNQENIKDIDYIIYPYHEDKSPILEAEFCENFPLAYKYLLYRRDKLENRDKGKISKYESWFAFGRKQGLHSGLLNGDIQKIWIVPQLIGGTCLPRELDLSTVMKNFKTFVFNSGYVVTDEKEGCRVLSSEFLNFAKINGKAWPGKNEPYYALTVKQIREFLEDVEIRLKE